MEILHEPHFNVTKYEEGLASMTVKVDDPKERDRCLIYEGHGGDPPALNRPAALAPRVKSGGRTFAVACRAPRDRLSPTARPIGPASRPWQDQPCNNHTRYNFSLNNRPLFPKKMASISRLFTCAPYCLQIRVRFHLADCSLLPYVWSRSFNGGHIEKNPFLGLEVFPKISTQT